MQDRQIAFGLSATTTALKAKTGQLRLTDQVGFAVGALEMVHDDVTARQAAIDFLTECSRHPQKAGAQLQDFILKWSAGRIDPHYPERILAEMPETTADWQPEDNHKSNTERRL